MSIEIVAVELRVLAECAENSNENFNGIIFYQEKIRSFSEAFKHRKKVIDF